MMELFENISSCRLDKLFKDETGIVFRNTNCLSCANCCRNYSPIIEPEEIPLLAKAIKIEPQILFDQYIEMDEDGDFVFRHQPCPMLNLEDNKCKIYELRPKACREYPHTNMKNMASHLDLLAKNIEICPAADEILQRVIQEVEKNE